MPPITDGFPLQESLVEYIYIENTVGQKGAFYQTLNRLDRITNAYTNWTQPNVTKERSSLAF